MLSIRVNCSQFLIYLFIYCMLCMRETNFIIWWNKFGLVFAYGEMIFCAHWVNAEMFKIRTSYFKNLVLQALGTIRIWFLQKPTNKSHACVPLRQSETRADNWRGTEVYTKTFTTTCDSYSGLKSTANLFKKFKQSLKIVYKSVFYHTAQSKNGGGEVQHASPALLTSQGDPGHQQVNYNTM